MCVCVFVCEGGMKEGREVGSDKESVCVCVYRFTVKPLATKSS